MDMLLRDVTIHELAVLFDRHADASPAPHLVDAARLRRARRLARTGGVWDDLTEHLDPARDIPVIKR